MPEWVLPVGLAAAVIILCIALIRLGRYKERVGVANKRANVVDAVLRRIQRRYHRRLDDGLPPEALDQAPVHDGDSKDRDS